MQLPCLRDFIEGQLDKDDELASGNPYILLWNKTFEAIKVIAGHYGIQFNI